jgi:predicted nucleic acid-binding protein
LNRWYVDTSAALKLIVDESESSALEKALNTHRPQLVACLLLETELRRAMHRDPALNQATASRFLEGVDLYEMPVSLFQEAGLLPGVGLRSLDALHLAGAIRLGVDHVLTYDIRMTTAARELGLSVLSPTDLE